jgi:hypothetical protein
VASDTPLPYLVPGSEWVQWAAVALGGVLEQLRTLAERLAWEHSWQEPMATVFVLTGEPPAFDGLRMERDQSRAPMRMESR